MNVLLILILAIAGAQAFLFSRGSRRRLKQNCRWMPWRDAACVRMPDSSLRRQQIRIKINARYGGRSCPPGDTKRLSRKACSDADYITSVIKQMIGSARSKSTIRLFSYTKSRQGFLSRPKHFPSSPPSSMQRVCSKPFNSSSTGVRLLGKSCTDDENQRNPSRLKRDTAPFNGTFVSYHHRDVMFLVDESGSISAENFQKELRFVKALARNFCGDRIIQRDKTRVALTTFQEDSINHIQFYDHATAGSFRNAVDTIPQRGGSTCAVNALNAVRDRFVQAEGSRVESKEVDGLVIMITDGCFNCYTNDLKTELARQLNLFKQKGIFLMTFMIGASNECLENLQHLFDGSVCFQGVSLPTWSDFDDQVRNLESTNEGSFCIDQWTKNTDDCP